MFKYIYIFFCLSASAENMFAIQVSRQWLILTYFDPIQTELKDRLMIYFAFQTFLSDIKLTETYFFCFSCCSNVSALHLFRHSGILIAHFQK